MFFHTDRCSSRSRHYGRPVTMQSCRSSHASTRRPPTLCVALFHHQHLSLRKNVNSKGERWKGPYQVLLGTRTAVKVKGNLEWVHATRCRLVPRGKHKWVLLLALIGGCLGSEQRSSGDPGLEEKTVSTAVPTLEHKGSCVRSDEVMADIALTGVLETCPSPPDNHAHTGADPALYTHTLN
ncbi:uncharacterized protein AKAME5_002274900 [Lates japonicus]|uniref:Murine leukemia virus integrase C-terminal domain-containing protein n=1 Tax=Lates japonicus TaxID=270547 RepID=A0AAD3NBH5_LATJO|nr:uncharacterized protein AKAME5_000488900 [Lates japonicus]GLD71427.1 uncharacterized protein AKAME5_002274900 [Lates japonicus]